jgi:uncharacterized protein
MLAVLMTATGLDPATAADPSPQTTRHLQQGGQDYEQGDTTSAWFHFWTLARQGDPTAQFNLAQLYRLGEGIPVDLRLALYWYAEAAAQGHGYAQYNLGIMYERGDGVGRDLTEAKAWYHRAAAQKIREAEAALRRLDKPDGR